MEFRVMGKLRYPFMLYAIPLQRGVLMKARAEVFQFLSRSNIPTCPIGTSKISPQQRPDIAFSIDIDLCPRSFDLTIATPYPRQPSIGAAEYVDSEFDVYISDRWPMCIRGLAEFSISEEEFRDNAIIKKILLFLQQYVWTIRNDSKVIQQMSDQLTTQTGYRRQYFNSQMFDISGNRRPSSSEKYEYVSTGSYAGPGAVVIDSISFPKVNELIWSQTIPFDSVTNIANDFAEVKKRAKKIKLHYNSYSEIRAAKEHLANGDLKACIRFAAPSIEAILKYYCGLWNVIFPRENISFDAKIEKVLSQAGKPSYKSVAPDNLKQILYLYLARNSSHEADCYYTDDSGKVISVRTSHARTFIKAAEEFTLWIDAIV